MESIHVVAAIIRQGGKVLATQRGHGDHEGGWEFPGGKVEPGETPEQAIVREIAEELDARIVVERLVTTVDHDYETFHLHMDCFLCSLGEGGLTLREHHAAKWLDAEHLGSVAWIPADVKVVEALREQGVV